MGYGFVDFVDHSTAERAMMAFNGRVLYGQDLRINWASAAGREDTSQVLSLWSSFVPN
jgi:nucleolysin TIA-1/TIAR